jgi:hypothetical protein
MTLPSSGEILRARTMPYRPPSTEPGRNDPCPCGSGYTYKRCHGEWLPRRFGMAQIARSERFHPIERTGKRPIMWCNQGRVRDLIGPPWNPQRVQTTSSRGVTRWPVNMMHELVS